VVNGLRIMVLAIVITVIGVLGSYAGNPSAAQVAGDVGYRDFSFAANGVSNPTGEKPQSKLWFNDGVWWGSMFDRSTEEYHIYRYDWASHTWSDTGTLIDERNTSKADTLWDGTHLYVVSAGTNTTNSSHGARVLRYSYNPATEKYTLDQGFPVTITSTGLETIVLDRDTTGKLWVTYEQNQQIYVNRSLNDDRTWGTPFVLPVNGTSVAPDDISSVVAFDSQVGVMWSNQTDDAMYFATHKDGDPDNV
jgi:type II secretory pathway pseudopilin PulG